MFRKLIVHGSRAALGWILLLGAAAGVQAQESEPPARQPEAPGYLEVEGTRIRFYGFPRLDAVWSDSRLNHNQYSMWVLSEDPTAAPEENDEYLDIYPRLTRLGLKIERDSLPLWEDAELSGNVEIDFQNAGSESRQLLRLRHGYLKVADGGFSILAGQTWDVISPLWPSVNTDGVMWNSGNIGDRRPQLRIAYETGVFDGAVLQGAVALGRTGAIDLKDLDGDGRRDGDESGLPMIQARIGLSSLWEKRIDVGIWAHIGWEELATPVGGEDTFTSAGFGLDLKVRITDQVTFAAELWSGRNLSDVRGGIAQGVNTATGDEIAARGGWAEIAVKATEWYTPAVGVALDDPDDDDLTAASSRSKNTAVYVANKFDLGGGFIFGLEYIRWETEYLGIDEGDANRFNLFVLYKF